MKSLRIQKKLGTGLVAGLAVFALAACTGNDSNDDKADLGGGTSKADNGSNDEAGDKVVIGFSAPAADHGWMGSITAVRPGRSPSSTTTSSCASPRAPTTSTCRSPRSRRSSTTASTPSCCCPSTVRR